MSIPDNLKQTFSSDFSQFANGGVSKGQFQTTLPHNLRNVAGTGELEYYSDPSVGVDPFSVNNGSLDITARAGSTVPGTSYTSGVITTESSFSQLYGYFQMTATLPTGTGYWPAFWLLPANLSGTQELDVMEEFGSNSSQYSVSTHSPSSGITNATIPTGDLSAGPNTYGMYWTPDSISYYLNGKLVAVTPTPPDMNTPMFMIADLAIASNVSPTTAFPGTMEISSIQAYAYDPNVPGPTPPLLTNVPTAVATTTNHSIAINGVSISDPTATSSDIISVTISDKSLGILSVTAQDGAVVSINNGWEVQLSGSLSAVNATLQTLAYKNVPLGTTPPTTDTITVTANDPNGNFDSSRTSVTINASSPAMQFITVNSQSVRESATGNDAFIFNAGQIPDPARNNGQSNQIINFHTAAQSAGGPSDFLAFQGFDSSAQLVFSHYANVNGTPNESLQYYQVDTATGNSPIFMVQMAGGSTAHLSNADFGFYPT
jgi:beta-glucanase (GH16 family)